MNKVLPWISFDLDLKRTFICGGAIFKKISDSNKTLDLSQLKLETNNFFFLSQHGCRIGSKQFFALKTFDFKVQSHYSSANPVSCINYDNYGQLIIAYNNLCAVSYLIWQLLIQNEDLAFNTTAINENECE